MLLVALLLACGADTPPPPAPTPAKAAPPVKAAPPADMPLDTRGRVFLVGGEVGFVPVACHDLQGGARSLAGDACLPMLPVGSAVRAEDGGERKVSGTAKEPCGGVTAVTVEGSADAWRGHATTPPVQGEWVEVVPPVTPPEADKAAPDELRRRLVEQLGADRPELAAAAKKLQIRQRAVVDLDGDGQPEQLAAVALTGAPGEDGEETLAYAGLYLVPAGDVPPRALVGAAPGGPQYTVLGTLDLDADGKRELWLNTYEADRFTQSVQQVGPAGLVELGSWGCG